MAKSGQKRKRADKAKTKLKTSGKGVKKSIRLPKGLNVTRTDFTTKTITVNQLKKDLVQGDKVTKKKIGFKDLMSKLNNSSQSTRLDGLEGIVELVKAYPELADEHLSQLVQRIAPLTTDRDGKMRKVASGLLHFVLTNVEPLQLEPLYDIISAHVCCGLSHIDVDIQLDSLKLLDEIISAVPQLVASKHDQLLPNCLDQVSLRRGPSSGVTHHRTLSSNMSDKLTAVQWRSDVLSRVHTILQIVHDGNNVKYEKQDTMTTKNAKNDFYMGLYADPFNSNVSIQSLDKSGDEKKNVGGKEFNMSKFIDQGLVNLLLDTWCEAIASCKSDKDNNGSNCGLVNANIITCLETIAKTFRLALHLLGQTKDQLLVDSTSTSLLAQFEEKYSTQILHHLMVGFPYDILQQQETKERQKKSVTVVKGKQEKIVPPTELNLTLCLIYLELMAGDDDEMLANISRYLNNVILSPESHHLDKVTQVLKQMSRIDAIHYNELISDVLNKNPTNNKVVDLMIYLVEYKVDLPIVQEWIKDLANVVTSGKVSHAHLDVISTLYKRGDVNLAKALEHVDSTTSKDTKVWKTMMLWPQFRSKVDRKQMQNVLENDHDTLEFCQNMLTL